MRSARTEAFWNAFCRHEGANSGHYEATYFRAPPDVADRLLANMLAGAKRAAVGLLAFLGEGKEEPVPQADDYSVLLDRKGRPRLIWRSTNVVIAPFSSVSDEFVWRDGAGNGDRTEWMRRVAANLRGQERKFGFEMHDLLETVFETLEVVWPLEVAERIRLITPHLDRGLALLRRAAEQGGVAAGLEAVLTQVLTAVMVVGPDGRLRFANASAEALLRRGDGVHVRNGHLVARWRAEERVLNAAISAAGELPASVPAPTAGATSAVVISLHRDEGCPPYRASIFPLRRGGPGRGPVSQDGVVLFIDDPDADAPLTEQAHVSKTLRLTPAEARLAILLAKGVSLTEAADQFGVTRNTVRAQLRAIFDKTDTHRQIELARLIQGSKSLRIRIS